MAKEKETIVSGDYKVKILFVLIVTVASIIIFIPTINNSFVFDDESLVGENELIRNLEHVPEFFVSDILNKAATSDRGPLYRPLLLTNLSFESKIFGHSALAFHIINVLLHAVAAILFFFILTMYFGFSIKSLLPALVFAVHPVHVDAVAFIINRSEIMALIFLFLGFIAFKKSDSDNFLSSFTEGKKEFTSKFGIMKIFFAFLAFLCALLCKETALTAILFIVIFFLIKYLNGSGLKRFKKPGLFLLGLFCFAIIYFYLRYISVASLGSDPDATIFAQRNFRQIFPTMSRVFLDYIKMLIYPLSLRVDYSDYEISGSIFDLKALIAYIVHFSIFSLAILSIRKKPFISFIIFCFYASLSPVSQIIPFNDIKAERFLYLPSVFFSLSFGFLLMQIRESSKHFKNISLVIILIIVSYGALALRYSSNFISEEILWSAMIERSPENKKMNYNLGLHLWKRHEFEHALPFLEKTVKLDKYYYRAYAPLAVSYSMLGKTKKARITFETGLKIAPYYPLLNQNYAVFNYFRGDLKKAYFYIMRAYGKQPGNQSIINIKTEIEKKLKLYAK